MPPELLGYAFTIAFEKEFASGNAVTIPILDAVSTANSPGAAFAFTAESLFETLEADRVREAGITIVGQASQRAVKVPPTARLDWLRRYYDRTKEDSHAA